MKHASDSTPRSGENVSENRYDKQAATAGFFWLYEDLVADHYRHAARAVDEGEYEKAAFELERVQQDLEVLKELISDE